MSEKTELSKSKLTEQTEQQRIKEEQAAWRRAMKKDKTIETFPCLAETQLTEKCMWLNGYNRAECSDEFKNYKNCKIFWTNIKKHRKLNGIQPNLPPLSEREAAREYYSQLWGKKKYNRFF